MRYILALILTFILCNIQDTSLIKSNIGFQLLNNRPHAITDDNECTIIIASGRATIDGRPILWKNRDVTEEDQRFLYIPSIEYPGYTSYGFIGNFYTSDSTRCFMGVNQAGFGLINANCYNLDDILEDGIDDGDLIYLALQRCGNIEEWEEFLEITGLFGRRACWTFAAIDASGAAKVYECDNFHSTVYDVNDTLIAPDGYLIRSVFGFSGDASDSGLARYYRADYLTRLHTEHYPLDVKFILQTLARDFSLSSDMYNHADDPYPLPYYGSQRDLPTGYVYVNETINRFKTRSCLVIRGVLPGEDPQLATTYVIIGQPVLSLAVPLWTASQYVPYCLRGDDQAPWYALIEQRMEELYPLDITNSDQYMNSLYLLDSLKTGVYSWSLDLENWGIDQADSMVADWRENGFDIAAVRDGEMEISEVLWEGFVGSSNHNADCPDPELSLPLSYKAYNYPNPFNMNTSIYFELLPETAKSFADVNIYTILGQKVTKLKATDIENGKGSVIWDGTNSGGEQVAAGMYLYTVQTSTAQIKGKMLLLK